MPFAHGDARRRLERHFGGVDVVIGAVRQIDGEVDDREAERSLHHPVADALLDRRNILLGHDAAGDRVGEGEACAARQRLDLDDDVAELAVAARLLLVAAADLHRLADRLLDRRCGAAATLAWTPNLPQAVRAPRADASRPAPTAPSHGCRWLCSSDSEGSSSMSLAMALVSFTSSLRSATEMAMP